MWAICWIRVKIRFFFLYFDFYSYFNTIKEKRTDVWKRYEKCERENMISDDKITESRMRWCGQVMRRDENHIVKKTLVIQEEKIGRGSPYPIWMSTVEKDLRTQNSKKRQSRTGIPGDSWLGEPTPNDFPQFSAI